MTKCNKKIIRKKNNGNSAEFRIIPRKERNKILVIFATFSSAETEIFLLVEFCGITETEIPVQQYL